MLKLNIRVGEKVAIGGPTTVTVEAKSGQGVTLSFDADRSVPITRIDGSRPRGPAVGLGGNVKPQKGNPAAY